MKRVVAVAAVASKTELWFTSTNQEVFHASRHLWQIDQIFSDPGRRAC